jgi:hypothetical protein
MNVKRGKKALIDALAFHVDYALDDDHDKL